MHHHFDPLLRQQIHEGRKKQIRRIQIAINYRLLDDRKETTEDYLFKTHFFADREEKQLLKTNHNTLV